MDGVSINGFVVYETSKMGGGVTSRRGIYKSMSGRVTEYVWDLQEPEVEKVSKNGYPKVDEPESDELQVAVIARPEVDDKSTGKLRFRSWIEY
jgi:hypothetical protein